MTSTPLLYFLFGDVCRTVYRDSGERIERLRCPYTYQRCNSECIALALRMDDLYCKAMRMDLGMLDPERIDLDIIDALKNGSDLKSKDAPAPVKGKTPEPVIGLKTRYTPEEWNPE